MYLREDRVVRAIDSWIATVFDQCNLDATCEAMESAGEVDPGAEAKAEAARRRIADCDARLVRYRSALDAGADPVVVAGWVKEVEAERKAAQRSLSGPDDGPTAFTRDQLRELVLEVGDAVAMLEHADPTMKSELYDELGLHLTYKPEEQLVVVESRPTCRTVGVGGGT